MPPIEPDPPPECNAEPRQYGVASPRRLGYPPASAMNPTRQTVAEGAAKAARYPWSDLPDGDLLKLRICHLELSLAGSPLEPRIARLYEELSTQGIDFHPRCYLTTEWLCPDRIPLIGVPFCLAHPRLAALERSMMLEVEGEKERSCMRLLRHEAGHALNYAYRLYRRTRWRELFGPISQEYNVREYYARPYSRRFVDHLPGNYAQAHPDEDFAETFAVWLTPDSDWARRYRGWKALHKLQYVDRVMTALAGAPPVVSGGRELWPARRLRSTLKTYYHRKRREFGEDYPGCYDPDLRRILADPQESDGPLAYPVLRRNRARLIAQISRGSRLRKYDIDTLLRRMTARARELRLVLRADESDTLLQVSVVITAMLCDARSRAPERILP